MTTLWTYEGIVREEGTNKPIAGAFVVAVWSGRLQTIAIASSGCYHYEITTTDQNGKFRISEFSGNLNPLRTNRRRMLSVYAPGYNISPNAPSEDIVLVVPRTGTKEEQFDQLQMASTFDCPATSDERLVPMYKALVAEEA